MASKTKETPDWLRLQRKIFSRWCNQKLSLSRGIQITDIVKELDTGEVLCALAEVLSELTFPDKLTKKPKLRVQKVDNLNRVLKWLFSECKIKTKIPPSAENLVDGDEKECLGLVWALMLRFMRFDDDDDEDGESMNAKDSLLLWVQNKIGGEPYNIQMKDFKKGWHDGRALCAILHKHRPKMLDWNQVGSDAATNLQLAFDVAEAYFGLEQYLSVDDIPKLDENSMVVYVSEYYYGIAEMRKIDLAARRVQKVITLTIENDALRKEYNETATKLCAHLEKVEAVLGDRTIDNTLAGAKARLEAFYDYKKNDKSVILGDQLNLESLYNNLAMRLTHHKRPPFQPAEGCTLKDIEGRMKSLEKAEAERKVALHAELNRQLRLVQLNSQHQSKFQKLQAWIAEKDAYTAQREDIDSVGTAQYQLKLLEAFNKENEQTKANHVVFLKKIGAELLQEKYENSADVSAREAEVDAGSSKIDGQSVEKKVYLDEKLALEIRKEELRQRFAELAADYNRWADATAENLNNFFGFELEDVEAFGATLEKEDKEFTSASQARYDEAISCFNEGKGIGIVENRYTTLSTADLDAAKGRLEAALGARKAAYDQELARQRKCDSMCQNFAGVADPFVAKIVQQKDDITHSQASLEEQLAAVETAIAQHSVDNCLDEIRKLQADLDGERVTNNKYTDLTAKDCEAQFDQFGIFLTRKKEMLEKEIEHQKLRGVTPEQYVEIEENFKQFDRDSDGAISKRELKGCLYSLGEEKGRKELAAIMEEFGQDGKMLYDQFKEFMIRCLGDSDTKEEILDAFKLINRGSEIALKDKMESVMSTEGLQYIIDTAPPVEGGYDYTAWTEDVFSR